VRSVRADTRPAGGSLLPARAGTRAAEARDSPARGGPPLQDDHPVVVGRDPLEVGVREELLRAEASEEQTVDADLDARDRAEEKPRREDQRHGGHHPPEDGSGQEERDDPTPANRPNRLARRVRLASLNVENTRKVATAARAPNPSASSRACASLSVSRL
jgi:hypothetical protein